MKKYFSSLFNLLNLLRGVKKNRKIENDISRHCARHRNKTEKIMAMDRSVYLNHLWLQDNSFDEKHKASPKWRLAKARIYNLKITIGEQDRLKILEFAKASPKTEVYIKMLVKREGNHFQLYRPLYFKQKGNLMETSINLQDEDEYIRKLIDSNLPPEEIEKEIISMRCWVHSHFGPCWWSDEDNANCERLNNKDFLISIVIRTFGNDLFYNCRLDLFPLEEKTSSEMEKLNIFRPSRLTLTDLEIDVVDDRGQDFDREKIKDEAKKLAGEKIDIISEIHANENGDNDDIDYLNKKSRIYCD